MLIRGGNTGIRAGHRTQTKGSLCFYRSCLFGKSAHSSQDSCAAHSRERSRKGPGQNKILPGLKWLKSERFFHFPHCRRFQPVYPGQSTQRKEGHERATDHYLRELLTSLRKNTTTVHQQGKDHPDESLTCLLPVSQLLQRASAGHMGEGTNVEAFQNTKISHTQEGIPHHF